MLICFGNVFSIVSPSVRKSWVLRVIQFCFRIKKKKKKKKIKILGCTIRRFAIIDFFSLPPYHILRAVQLPKVWNWNLTKAWQETPACWYVLIMFSPWRINPRSARGKRIRQDGEITPQRLPCYTVKSYVPYIVVLCSAQLKKSFHVYIFSFFLSFFPFFLSFFLSFFLLFNKK